MIPKVLQRPTLVLNRNWQPVNVATVARALVLLWNESARVVDPADYQLYTWADWSKLRPHNGEDCIRAVRFRLRVPEVVALNGYDRLPVAHVTFSRRNIFKRDHYTYQYCGAQPGSEELTLDHVLPRSQGGASGWENCVLACMAYNKRKADRTPEQARMHLRRKPVRPTWKPPGTDAQRWSADHEVRIESWSKFISEAYWNVTANQPAQTLNRRPRRCRRQEVPSPRQLQGRGSSRRN
jgi:5-methylcytosine-specific restriction endonuclease McrA